MVDNLANKATERNEGTTRENEEIYYISIP